MNGKNQRIDPREEEHTDSLGRYSFLEPGALEQPYAHSSSSPPPRSLHSRAIEGHSTALPATTLEAEMVADEQPNTEWVRPTRRIDLMPPRESYSDAEPIPLLHPRPTVVGARFVRSRTRAYASTLPFLSEEAHDAPAFAPSPDFIGIRPFFEPLAAAQVALASPPLEASAEWEAVEAHSTSGLFLLPEIVTRIEAEKQASAGTGGARVLLAVATSALVLALFVTLWLGWF